MNKFRGQGADITPAIMNRQQIWTVAGALLMVFGLQLFFGLQLHAQQADLGAAAAAKAAAGREALTHGASDASSSVSTFTTFDAPGAGTTGFAAGTTAVGINPEGATTGYYCNAGSCHGFLRARDGTFTTFDPPNSIFTQAAAINPEGAITGTYCDANFCYGFLRDRNGTFNTFNVPDAVFGFYPEGINPEGAIAGTYYDANFVGHGFFRASNRTLTTFDVPGAGSTTAVGITPDGVITGSYTDANNGSHGFLRTRDGSFTTFDPPGEIATSAPFSFGPDLSMNPEGVITGTYKEPISGNPFGGNYRVFVRASDGTFTTFDAATYPPCCIWSFPSGINPAGTITGSFNDGHTRNHGFLRAPDGTVTTFDVPGAGTGFNQGTVPLGIDPAGVIMGFYWDANGVSHGFSLAAPALMLSAVATPT